MSEEITYKIVYKDHKTMLYKYGIITSFLKYIVNFSLKITQTAGRTVNGGPLL